MRQELWCSVVVQPQVLPPFLLVLWAQGLWRLVVHWMQYQGPVRKRMPYQSRDIRTLECCDYTAVSPSLCWYYHRAQPTQTRFSNCKRRGFPWFGCHSRVLKNNSNASELSWRGPQLTTHHIWVAGLRLALPCTSTTYYICVGLTL